MENLLVINWNVTPDIVEIGPFTLRWYGLLFATGFLLSLEAAKRMFQHEQLPESWLEAAFIYIFFGTVLGARLGHVFFYDWDYYSANPIEIIKIHRGGLASHGAVIGILTGLWIYSRTVSKRPLLWVTDYAGAVIPLAGVFIRTGNLINHEIVGIPSDVSWAFIFKEMGDGIARHPTQIYEALCYLAIFGITMYFYWRTDAGKKTGFLTGLFFSLVFSARFFIEFLKENQSAFEDGMALNMGQLLSIPLVLLGIGLIIRAQMRGPQDYPPPKLSAKEKNEQKRKRKKEGR